MSGLPEPPTGLRRLTAPLRFLRRLRALPPRVALFQARARFLAWRMGDDAPKSAVRLDDLALLLELAKGRREVVELGTAKAWTSISLALAEPQRHVTTYDPIVQHARERYLGLVSSKVRDRISTVDRPGESGPAPDAPPVDFLFIDSSHDRETTRLQYETWKGALAPGCTVVFDDYRHRDFPGVGEAIDELRLDGRPVGALLFVHRAG